MDDILISVIVLSYNAEKTILDTLESVKRQSYKNIELIISDDCSRDNTLKIATDWLEVNANCFKQSFLLKSESNQGVCANFNKAIEKSTGLWYKAIAADDALLPTCIEDFCNYIKANPDASWISSYTRVYNGNFEDENCITRNKANLHFFELNVNDQLIALAKGNRISAPSVAIKRSVHESVGMYDTTYSFEDYPFFLRLLEKGYKCYFLNKETVCYRIHLSTYHAPNYLFNYKFTLESRKFEIKECTRYLTKRQLIGRSILWRTQDLLEKLNNAKQNSFNLFIYRVTYRIIDKFFGYN